MSKALIVRGYCGTGKSTVAKTIARKNNFVFLEYDNFLWGMNKAKKPSKFEYEITFKNFSQVLKNYLKSKKDIVIEGPLVSRTSEDPFEIKQIISMLKKEKYEYIIVQLIATEEICLQRMEKRNKIVPKWERDMFIQKHTSSIQKNEIIIDTSNLSIKQTQNKIEKLLKNK